VSTLRVSEAGTVQFPMVKHASEIGWTRRISYASCLVSETTVRLARALLRKVVGKPVVCDHSKTTESGERRNTCRGVDFRYATLPEACKCRT